MKLTESKALLLGILNYRELSFPQLIRVYEALNPISHKTYDALQYSIRHHLKELIDISLIKRHGRRHHYTYTITPLGIRQLLRYYFGKLTAVT